ncbi:MAG TPA: type II toxin-antitoxin system prevent-host-death family antitoxin [Candidatus Paceibacterota bacterium]|nr:type II toxin-antitoxin system prevent-host-death family antitoxin [Candidatus Paceibacterota bacterium]
MKAITVNIHEAKTHFSRLLRQVGRGQEVVVAKDGKPVAKIVALGSRRPRRPGRYQGVFATPETFFEPLPERELKAWEGAG